MSKILIEKASVDDLSILKEFEQGIVSYERPYDKTLDIDPISYYDLEALIHSAAAEVLVAVKDEVIVASGYAKILDAQPYLRHDRYAYLGFMYVVPTERGQGINKLIVDALVDWSKGQGITEVRLDVYSENKAALKAYDRVGFKGHLLNMRLDV